VISASDKRLKPLNELYEAAFGERIPLMMVPEGETIDGLTEKVNLSVQENRNLLPELYYWNNEDIY
jgi:hypothetical protein